ncbi:hypothetical protein [Actinoplanes sp. NPDC051494]|uniref:hypothetical protein n=1 Tax=Actinoplanes sp. NPDC051494 TaxID=3363907 RepID=UPI0037A7D2F6
MTRTRNRSTYRLVLSGAMVGVAAVLMIKKSLPGRPDPADEPVEYVAPAPPVDGKPPSSWQDATWEPYKIAIGAFYALCLQKAFDTVIAFFQKQPVDLSDPHAAITISSGQMITILQLGAYIIWVSIYFLHNGRLYFQLRPYPAGPRIRAHGTMTVGFAIFYFFGATLGHPGRLQIALIATIILVDMAFPLHLGGIARNRARVLWVLRGAAELAFVLALFRKLSDDQLTTIWWALVLFMLLVAQLFVVGPWEGRFQQKSALRSSYRTDI